MSTKLSEGESGDLPEAQGALDSNQRVDDGARSGWFVVFACSAALLPGNPTGLAGQSHAGHFHPDLTPHRSGFADGLFSVEPTKGVRTKLEAFG